MITGASLNFTSFTDEFIAWNTRAELQQFFEDIRVPVGSTDSYGVFKKVVATPFEVTEINNVDTYNLVVDGVSIGEVPTKESFVQLQNAFIALQESYNELLENL